MMKKTSIALFLTLVADCFDDDPKKFYFLEHHFDNRKSNADLAFPWMLSAFINRQKIPVLLIQPGMPKRMFPRRNRQNWDRIMRKNLRLASVDVRVKTPYLYGISGIGKSLTFYKIDVAAMEIEPELIADDPNDPDEGTVPASNWVPLSCQDQELAFRDMVSDIKQMVDQFRNSIWF